MLTAMIYERNRLINFNFFREWNSADGALHADLTGAWKVRVACCRGLVQEYQATHANGASTRNVFKKNQAYDFVALTLASTRSELWGLKKACLCRSIFHRNLSQEFQRCPQKALDASLSWTCLWALQYHDDWTALSNTVIDRTLLCNEIYSTN